MSKLLLLDCDGTIREPLSGEKFPLHSRDQKIITGADKAIAYFASNNWQIYGYSNQGGVAAGHKSLQDAIAEQQYTLTLFPQITAVFFCPDYEGNLLYKTDRREAIKYERDTYLLPYGRVKAFDSFRKPARGGIDFIVCWLNQNFEEILYIGDRLEDEQAAEAANIKFQRASKWRQASLNLAREGLI